MNNSSTGFLSSGGALAQHAIVDLVCKLSGCGKKFLGPKVARYCCVKHQRKDAAIRRSVKLAKLRGRPPMTPAECVAVRWSKAKKASDIGQEQ